MTRTQLYPIQCLSRMLVYVIGGKFKLVFLDLINYQPTKIIEQVSFMWPSDIQFNKNKK